MIVKTSEMTERQLDWAVAKCEGFRIEKDYVYTEEVTFDGWWQCGPNHWQPVCKYSTDWSQGGPIIEREEIGVKRNSPCSDGRRWEASPSITAKGAGGRYGYGQTPLIAAMRCYVASKLGETIEIPEELR